MKDKDKEEEDVKGPVEMEIRKPWDVNPSDQGITGEDFQSDQDEKQRTAESNEIVRKHTLLECQMSKPKCQINVKIKIKNFSI
jgi:hypothetical protein